MKSALCPKVEKLEHTADFALARPESCGINTHIPRAAGIRAQSGLYPKPVIAVYKISQLLLLLLLFYTPGYTLKEKKK